MDRLKNKMISKKALLIAMGLAFTVPGYSYASIESIAAQMAEEQDEQSAALAEAEKKAEQAAAEEKKVEQDLANKQSTLEASLKNSTMARKDDLLKQLKEFKEARAKQLEANKVKVEQYREQIKQLRTLQNRREKANGKTMKALAETYSVSAGS